MCISLRLEVFVDISVLRRSCNHHCAFFFVCLFYVKALRCWLECCHLVMTSEAWLAVTSSSIGFAVHLPRNAAKACGDADCNSCDWFRNSLPSPRLPESGQAQKPHAIYEDVYVLQCDFSKSNRCSIFIYFISSMSRLVPVPIAWSTQREPTQLTNVWGS